MQLQSQKSYVDSFRKLDYSKYDGIVNEQARSQGDGSTLSDVNAYLQRKDFYNKNPYYFYEVRADDDKDKHLKEMWLKASDLMVDFDK